MWKKHEMEMQKHWSTIFEYIYLTASPCFIWGCPCETLCCFSLNLFKCESLIVVINIHLSVFYSQVFIWTLRDLYGLSTFSNNTKQGPVICSPCYIHTKVLDKCILLCIFCKIWFGDMVEDTYSCVCFPHCNFMGK